MSTPKKESVVESKKPKIKGLRTEPPLGEHNYRAAFNLKRLISPLKIPAGTKSEVILKVIDLKDDLDKHSQRWSKALNAFMDGYPSVQTTTHPLTGDKSYNYIGHEQESEIFEGLTDLDLQSIRISPVNFLTDQEFVGITEGLTVDAISFLRHYLMKK